MIIDQMFETIEKITMEANVDYVPSTYHWSSAEVSFLKRANARHGNVWNINKLNFFDFLTVMKEEPIVVKGALNYSLKTIGKALHGLSMIETNWDEGECSNGLDAMILAYNYYRDGKKGDIMDSIIKYNEIDCKMICEIINCLRINNVVAKH